MRCVTPLLLGLTTWLSAQHGINGPMPGHTDMLEATIWLQCHGPCAVQLEYWDVQKPDSILRTVIQDSDASLAHAMDFTMAPVVPGTTYGYRVVKDGRVLDLGQTLTFKTQALWRHRTDPPDFTVAMGSCTYINEPAYDRPGRAFGSDYGIFDAIADKGPDLMLWLGDNTYLRESDWGSRSGYLHRYTHTRSTPQLQRLLRSTHHYAIWDDHDFGPNDADGGWLHSAMSRTCFDLFWPNPTCGVPGVEGITTAFNHSDIEFFLLDNRTFRVPGNLKTEQPAMLGKAQIDWLIRELKYSTAPFKLVAVGSQVLNTAAVYENYATIADERAELLRRIEVEGITGVVFLTGDRHFTELSSLSLKDGRVLYDLTVSPLTSGTFPPKEENLNRVTSTVVEQHNFAMLSFSGPRKSRVMHIAVYDAKGQLLWDRTIPEETKR